MKRSDIKKVLKQMLEKGLETQKRKDRIYKIKYIPTNDTYAIGYVYEWEANSRLYVRDFQEFDACEIEKKIK